MTTTADHLGEATAHVGLMADADDPLRSGIAQPLEQVRGDDAWCEETFFQQDGFRPDLTRDHFGRLAGTDQRTVQNQFGSLFPFEQPARQLAHLPSSQLGQLTIEIG